MQPTYENGNITTRCPDCHGAVTTYFPSDASKSFGSVMSEGQHWFENDLYRRILYILFKCAGCGRGGLGKFHDNGTVRAAKLEWFIPASIQRAALPNGVPTGIVSEYREAETCASVSAWRAASGLLRSTLEKLLKANGYTKGSLAARIDAAATDGVITEARRKRAHEEVRVLGNDVLHDEWREVEPQEVVLAHHYVQRIAEDLYDDRTAVEAILIEKGRMAADG